MSRQCYKALNISVLVRRKVNHSLDIPSEELFGGGGIVLEHVTRHLISYRLSGLLAPSPHLLPVSISPTFYPPTPLSLIGR
jgi:hypothetical protein